MSPCTLHDMHALHAPTQDTLSSHSPMLHACAHRVVGLDPYKDMSHQMLTLCCTMRVCFGHAMHGSMVHMLCVPPPKAHCLPPHHALHVDTPACGWPPYMCKDQRHATFHPSLAMCQFFHDGIHACLWVALTMATIGHFPNMPPWWPLDTSQPHHLANDLPLMTTPCYHANT
jgi:hypothetical protein